GDASFVANRNNTVTGYYSTAFGTYNYAPSRGEFVIGNYATTYTANSNLNINSADRVFTIGNGTGTGSRSDAMVVLKSGNVGIGTSSPAVKLHITGSIRMVDGNQGNGKIMVSDANGTGSWQTVTSTISSAAWGLTGNSGTAPGTNFIGTTDAVDWIIKTNNTERMSITSAGYVGIGTLNPTQAMLVVNGSQSLNTSFGYLNSGGNTGTSSGTNAYSIYASARIAATEFNAYSDARIKHVIGITNNKDDLYTLAALQVTDYRYIDSIGKGNREVKKVIAQQVEQVYPQAVNKMTDAVPDIYQLARIKNGYVQMPNSLKAGERVKLILNNRNEVFEVKSADINGFTVDATDTGKVFVYGREVIDFRTVDYEALTTLNISATQELLKMINRLEGENNELKTRIDKLDANMEKMIRVLGMKEKAAME
ncbi:MAG TPA: tail fiber domain-containing protein, partial [Chitinophagales bacterium]|nr:tail fiber domain-containing protein [Chitinophagales bacterium]